MSKKSYPPAKQVDDQRTAPRVAVDTPADVQIDDVSFTGHIANVSPGGALVTMNDDRVPKVGSGVRVRFRLPGHVELEVLARVRWTRKDPVSFGIEFFGLGQAETNALRQFVEGKVPTSSNVHAAITERYAVEGRGNALKVWVNGSLEVIESKDLGESVVAILQTKKSADLHVFIDATRMSPCSDESLEEFKRWMLRLRACRSVIGIVVAPHAVSMLQMRRLAREAGVGDSLACFTNARDGERFWGELQDTERAAIA